MKKSRVSFTPSTSRDRHTATGVSYRSFFERFEKMDVADIPAAFNKDKDKDGHLIAKKAGDTVEVKSTENGHVLARYYKYQ